MNASVEEENAEGCNAIILAASNGYADTLRLLLERGGSWLLERCDDNDCTALHRAAANNQVRTSDFVSPPFSPLLPLCLLIVFSFVDVVSLFRLKLLSS